AVVVEVVSTTTVVVAVIVGREVAALSSWSRSNRTRMVSVVEAATSRTSGLRSVASARNRVGVRGRMGRVVIARTVADTIAVATP
ncbi:hypothetical protein K7G98_39965, partial [Saccharothrix sp. MB29]|nr:hypothetical protein [Saccharothrix sp. MB29]